ncbi:MAG: hypothetical protein K0U93_21580 [Gammaproteobacteria bacterium]|nr:hypothetical protein [Gammaproteobacteria bacterium]
MASGSRFGFSNFLIRFVCALVLVAATYNPSGKSYYHWVLEPFVQPSATETTSPATPATEVQAASTPFSPEKAVVGLLLLIGWIIFLRATFRSLGPVGIVLTLAFLAALVWLAFSNNWLSGERVDVLNYVAILLVALLLAIGLSWSHVRRRISGQADVDDVDA